jgi:hypothetical protein
VNEPLTDLGTRLEGGSSRQERAREFSTLAGASSPAVLSAQEIHDAVIDDVVLAD